MFRYKAMAVPDFMNRQAPPGYIAGLGRGAVGFTTRSDLGGTRVADDAAVLAARQAAQGKGPKPEIEQADQYKDAEVGLFASMPYDKEDEEADRIYDMVDKKMSERRKKQNESREKLEFEKHKKETPTIQQQFSDLKRDLSTMSEADWDAIPQVGDLVRRKGKKIKNKFDTFAPLPDSVILSAAEKTQHANVIQETDFASINEAKDKVIGQKLDKVSDSVSGQTTIDPKGYLTDLSTINIKSDTEISDIKKARMLLKSVISTNPTHAPGWIAAARLEEAAGKMNMAREMIAQGCDICPSNEDIWLEAARLNTDDVSRRILATAVRHVPKSVKVWLQAKDLETDAKAQKLVLRRALEYIPDSIQLWKAAINLEEDTEDARILLSRAVECVPQSIDLWIALAKLETYQNAKKVLNKARLTIPTSYEIWVHAAKLEERNNNTSMVEKIIVRAISDLSKKGASLSREEWIEQAQKCETEDYPVTCQAILHASIGLDVEDEDRQDTWIDDADRIAPTHPISARCIYAHTIEAFPESEDVWKCAAFFEKDYGTSQSLQELLSKAVQACPDAQVLWLMLAKDKWIHGDLLGAKQVLQGAFSANPDSEEIWLAAIKLEVESEEYENARKLLTSARQKANTPRVWMKSAVLERQLGNTEKALQLLDESLHFSYEKLYLIKGQIQESIGDYSGARVTYELGTKKLPQSVLLWMHASRVDERDNIIKARSTLEKARILNPKNPDLWLETIRLEQRANNSSMANVLLSKALQECPDSGQLWSLAILMEVRPQRKARSADALKKCDNDPQVLCTVARLFLAERKLDKAKAWFQRAIKANKDYGDGWAWLYKYETLHGSPQDQEKVIQDCIEADPRHGEEWQKVGKNPLNFRLSTKDILKLVAQTLE